MANRYWGPVQGAGVAVIEQDAEKLIEPSPLGVTAYFGVTQKGEVGKVNTTLSKSNYAKKLGSYFSGYYTPDCSLDFWVHSAGAGELHVVRVTDGTEVVPEKAFWNQNSSVPGAALKIKAANGGRWAGQKKAFGGEATMASDLAETTLDTGETMLLNEWAGGFLLLDEVSGKSYKVVSNDIAGIVTVSSDYTMDTDYASGTDEGWTLLRYNSDVAVSVAIGDGDDDAVAYFSMTVYVDGLFVKRYPNLSMDSTNKYYIVNIVNDDSSNDEVEVEMTWTGSDQRINRPACHYGVSTAVAATLLTCEIHHLVITSPGGANPTTPLGTLTDDMQWEQVITCTVTDDVTGAFSVSSDVFGAQSTAGAIDGAYTPDSPYVPPFTLTDGSTTLSTNDVVKIYYKPFWVDGLIGHTLIPDYGNERRETWRITDNTVATITVSGEDLTATADPADDFMVIAPIELCSGYDGGAPTDANFTTLMSVDTSPLRGLLNQGKGLVKVATPGHVSSVVDKVALSFVEAMNWQYRVEHPTATLTEVAADTYINDTVGRNDFGVTTWPSWGYVDDPEKSGQYKRIPMTGAIQGRESLMAKNYQGYHKAAAGVNVTLPRVLKLDVGEEIPINEEYTNRLGINIVKKVKGNYVIWGDRTISVDPAWKWKHQREMMSHYERQLQESFNWIIFAINDSVVEKSAKATLLAFFRPEWVKGALRGAKFGDAVSIKIDSENNTDATRAAGDMYADIILRLADTIERFKIRIGKAGVSESVN